MQHVDRKTRKGNKHRRALWIAAAALLQTTLMGYIEIASIRPNLQVILATSFALMCGSKTGLTVGALAGFFLDLVSGSTPGFYYQDFL